MEVVEVDFGSLVDNGGRTGGFSIDSVLGGILDNSSIGIAVGAMNALGEATIAAGGPIGTGGASIGSGYGGNSAVSGQGGSGGTSGEGGAGWFTRTEQNLANMLAAMRGDPLPYPPAVQSGTGSTGTTGTTGESRPCNAVDNWLTEWTGIKGACDGGTGLMGGKDSASIPVIPFVKRVGVFIVAVVFIAAALYMLAD